MSSDEKQKTKPRWEEPVISVQQIKDQIRELNDKVKKILSKPVPAPPKVETKPEAPKEESKKEEKMEEEKPQTGAG